MPQLYFIALVLPQELNEKVLAYKNFMLQKFDCKVGLKSPAHITLIPPFWMDDTMEAQLLNDVEDLSEHFVPFAIATNNFSAFKPRTIFIAVQPNKKLDEIKHLSDAFFGERPDYKIKIENRPFHPHITIATRDVHKKVFFEAWPLFENKLFAEEWEVRGLSILRHNKKNWDVIQTSQFSAV